ncbi:unnamed protein product [Lactuca saligna]|uniref:Uncharacterized protein n=1 Tax=Lactuca saligna TaxID=75948 RepID=A0AA36DWH9_LACSI|nr:unnamed protein product [Lactuca saligna]
MVAEEHVAPSKSNLNFSFEVSDDVNDDDDDDDDDVNDDDNDDDYDDDDDDDDVNDDDNDDDYDDDDVDEDVRVFKPSKEPVNGVSTTRKPPQAVPVTTKSPSGSDKENSNASMVPRKQSRRDPRPGELITVPVQQPTSNVEPAQVNQDDQSPIFGEDFLANEETFASGSFLPHLLQSTILHLSSYPS